MEVDVEEEVSVDDDEEDQPRPASRKRLIEEVEEEMHSGVEGQYNLCYGFSHISIIYLVIQLVNEINDNILLCIYCDK